MTCLWEAMYCQIIYLLRKNGKEGEEKKAVLVCCLPTNLPDVFSAGMGIWVRLSRSLFGVVSPS